MSKKLSWRELGMRADNDDDSDSGIIKRLVNKANKLHVDVEEYATWEELGKFLDFKLAYMPGTKIEYNSLEQVAKQILDHQLIPKISELLEYIDPDLFEKLTGFIDAFWDNYDANTNLKEQIKSTVRVPHYWLNIALQLAVEKQVEEDKKHGREFVSGAQSALVETLQLVQKTKPGNSLILK